MQYLMSCLHRERYGIISVAKNPFNVSLQKLELYQNISEDLYNECKNHSIIVEPDYKLMGFNNLNNSQIFLFAYYYYYLKQLHQIINNNYCSYEWAGIDNELFHNNMTPEKFLLEQEGRTSNQYLKNFSTQPNELALDIINNGTYFPMSFYKLNGNKNIVFGRHRFYSLYKNKELLLKRKFLFLDFSNFAYIWNIIDCSNCQILLKPIQNNSIDCFLFSNDKKNIFKTQTKYSLLFWNYFRCFSDELGKNVYAHRNNILPHPIFNNEKAWEKFINSPFQEIAELENFQ